MMSSQTHGIMGKRCNIALSFATSVTMTISRKTVGASNVTKVNFAGAMVPHEELAIGQEPIVLHHKFGSLISRFPICHFLLDDPVTCVT